jgi:hypothetical protein
MRAGRLITLAVGLLAVQACTHFTVESDYDREADFSAYATYDWMPPETRRIDLRVRDPRAHELIQDAIQDELGAKSLRRAEGADPDLLIGYHLALDEGLDSQTLYQGSAADWQYRTYGNPTTRNQSLMYSVGTLVIDVFDAAKEELIWRGVVEGDVKQNPDPDQRKERIEKAVQKMLEDFPPGG